MGLLGVAPHRTVSDTRRQVGVCCRDRVSTRRRPRANGGPRRYNPVRAYRRSTSKHKGLAVSLHPMPVQPCVILISNPDPTPSMIQTMPPDNSEQEGRQQWRIAPSSIGYAPCPVWPRPYGMSCPDSRPAERHAVATRAVRAGAYEMQAPAGERGNDSTCEPYCRFPRRPRAPLKLNVTHGDDWQGRLSAPLVRPHCSDEASHSPLCGRVVLPPSPALDAVRGMGGKAPRAPTLSLPLCTFLRGGWYAC